jgi:hypothetical protein
MCYRSVLLYIPLLISIYTISFMWLRKSTTIVIALFLTKMDPYFRLNLSIHRVNLLIN